MKNTEITTTDNFRHLDQTSLTVVLRVCGDVTFKQKNVLFRINRSIKRIKSRPMKLIIIISCFFIPICSFAQDPIKIFGKIQKGHPIYEVSNAICTEMETTGKFPNMSAMYARLKQPEWEKLMPKSYGPKINTELLCDCDVYLKEIIKYKEPTYHEKWSDIEQKMYELSHLAASTILTYREGQLLPKGLNNLKDQTSKTNIQTTGLRLAMHRDQLLYHIQSWYHEDRKAYKITYYRFFPFSEEFYLNNEKNIAFEIILNFDKDGRINEIYGVKDGPQYVFIKGHDKLEEQEDLPQFEDKGETMVTEPDKSHSISEIEEHHEIFKTVDDYHITTNGESMGLKSTQGKFYLNHVFQDIKHVSGTNHFKVVKSPQKQGIYDPEKETFIIEPENSYVQYIENNGLKYYLVTNRRLRNWFDETGKPLFPKEQRMISIFGDGILTQDGKTVKLYNSSFEMLYQGQYQNASISVDPAKRLFVYDGEFTLLLDEHFKVIVPSNRYNHIRQIGNGLYQTSRKIENNEWNYGLIDHNGQVVFECKYPNSIGEIGRNGETFFKVPVTKETFTYYLNNERIFSDAFSAIYDIAAGGRQEYFVVTKNNKQGIIDRNDKYIHHCVYDEMNQSYAYAEEFKDLFTIEEQKLILVVARKDEDWYALKKNGNAEIIVFK